MMNFVYGHPYWVATIATLIVNMIIKRIWNRRHSPLWLLVLLLFNAIPGCSPLGERVSQKNANYYYDIKADSIFFCLTGNWFEVGKHTVNADVDSFEVLDNYFWARDKNHIFYYGYDLDYLNIDLDSFEVIDLGIGRDKDRLYVQSRSDAGWQEQIRVLVGANPNTFEEVDNIWSKDDQSMFLYYEKVNISPEGFVPLNDYFAMDANGVYILQTRRINGQDWVLATIDADPSQIVKVNQFYIRDNQQLYYHSFDTADSRYKQILTVPFQQVSDIHFYNDYYFRVGNQVYLEAERVEGADAASFHNMELSFMADKDHLFLDGKIVEGANVKELVYVKEKFCYADMKNYYYTNGHIEAKGEVK